jgi:DNA-binding LytR/AlgR family response regulator
MRVIIIEDEFPAMEKLERYILKFDNSIEVVTRLSSISETISWLKVETNTFDLAFMDIQLTDGLSFEIFNQVNLSKPVIFTTAFDEFAIDAFKVNSIDYILKPITFTDVSKALTKHKNLKESFVTDQKIGDIVQTISEKKTKERFLVRLGNHIHSIKTNKISMFFAEGRTVFLVTNENKKYILDYKLEDLYNILDETTFFRVNRTFIININAIKDVVVYSNSRLKVDLLIKTEKDIIVSREKVNDFKSWFEGD